MIIKPDDWDALQTDLIALFSSSFNRSIEPGFFAWRYGKNPCGSLHFAVERNQQGVISSYSVSPSKLSCSDVIYDCALSMTTMTHPSARGKGYFPLLANELYQDLENQQIGLVWGFPNSVSHRVFNNKLGWKDLYEIPTLTLRISSFSADQLKKHADVGRDDRFDLSYPGESADNLIRVQKTKQYLKWRYVDNPVNKYSNFVLAAGGKASSYIVTKKYADDVDIVDMQVVNEGESRALLMHLIHHYFQEGIRCFRCWAPTHHFIHDILERLGFVNDSPITYFGARVLRDDRCPVKWGSFTGWYIQMGDSDVY
jgi:Acetyltransferase (GNAT) domain